MSTKIGRESNMNSKEYQNALKEICIANQEQNEAIETYKKVTVIFQFNLPQASYDKAMKSLNMVEERLANANKKYQLARDNWIKVNQELESN